MSAAGGLRGTRRALPVAGVVAAILLAAAVAGAPAGGPPLDPTSTAPGGTKAVVDTLVELGVDVAVEPAALSADVDRALLLIDDLSDDEREELEAWIDAGGVLVLTDPRSPLAPETAGSAAVGGVGVAPIEASCDLAALRDVPSVLPESTAVVYSTPEGAVGCFPRDEGHWLVATAHGRGVVVALGGPDVLVNARLEVEGHPELLAGLLARPDGRVAILRTRLPGAGEQSLVDLIPGNVKLFGLQLLIALLLVIAWRARRLGQPVAEPQPVAIPASELVTAAGRLLQERRGLAQAADELRADLRLGIRRRLGLPRELPDDMLAGVVASRTAADADELRAVLDGPPPRDEAELIELAAAIERQRAAVLQPTATTTGSRS